MTEPVEKNPGWLFGRWFWGLFALLAVALGVWLGVPYREHRRGEPGEFRVLTLECSSDGRPGAPHAVRVLVHDLRSGKPVAGERVEILGFPEPENGIPVGAGVTGSGGEWRAAWFTFSQGRGLLAVDADCEPGEELGNGGWAKGDPYPDLELDGRALPCSAALPVLCMPGLSG